MVFVPCLTTRTIRASGVIVKVSSTKLFGSRLPQGLPAENFDKYRQWTITLAPPLSMILAWEKRFTRSGIATVPSPFRRTISSSGHFPFSVCQHGR